MDSFFDKTIEITSGLGDCIVAAASVQKLSKIKGRKIKFKTSNKLNFLFDGHPNIELSNDSNTFNLKWASHLKDPSVYALHTMQRFSHQLGFYIDPVEVLHPYCGGQRIKNLAQSNLVCINDLSAEKNRRFIPREILDFLISSIKSKGYEINFIGDSSIDANSEKSIMQAFDKLVSCKLFIGPVSFYYHLASALGTKSLLFINYMPEHKFSHFFNTVSVNPVNYPCRFLCEVDENNSRNNMDCWGQCKAIDYNFNDITSKLNLLL